MSSDKVQPVLVLVTGLQGTGKSTVADTAALLLAAPVLSHDWAMSGLRPYPEMQRALDSVTPRGHGPVGWSILSALARAQLRRGSAVILDGMARAPDIERCHELAQEENVRFVIILTVISDGETHLSRIEGRQRAIPNWYELGWPDVQRSLASWSPPVDVDLTLDAVDPVDVNASRLASFLLDIKQ
jgi:predicted kinase